MPSPSHVFGERLRLNEAARINPLSAAEPKLARKGTPTRTNAKKAQPSKRGPTKKSGPGGKRYQPESAILKSKKSSKVASRRVAGAQRAAQARQQKRRDSH